jgi:hypothetical protein
VVDSAVDEWVTPEKLVNNEEVVKRRQEQKSFADFVTYAFFTSPTAFRADLPDPKDPNSPTLTVLMALSGSGRGWSRSSCRHPRPGKANRAHLRSWRRPRLLRYRAFACPA